MEKFLVQVTQEQLADCFTKSLPLPPLTDGALESIFTKLLGAYLAPFDGVLHQIVPALAAASVGLVGRMRAQLPPTPERPHYTFSLRDLRRLLQGRSSVAAGEARVHARMDAHAVHTHKTNALVHLASKHLA